MMMLNPRHEPLTKQIHEAEREIDAIECKIQSADLKTTYPQEYDSMRSEQEYHRQRILQCRARIDESLQGTQMLTND